MVSIDLKEAYLQVPIHPDSHKFLRFMAFGKPFQFRALCFSLSITPQVFTRVMAPVSSILHSLGIRLRCYLDDWLIQAHYREEVLCSLETILSLCLELGIVVNPEKSNLFLLRGSFVLERSSILFFSRLLLPTTSREASINLVRILTLQD